SRDPGWATNSVVTSSNSSCSWRPLLLMGSLVIVATPIGNLSDISPRALEALRSADLIACEDTRQTIKLLNHFGIQKALVSYHDFNEEKKAAGLGSKIRDGMTIALVFDRGPSRNVVG